MCYTVLFYLKDLKAADCVILFILSFLDFTVQVKHFAIYLCHKRKEWGKNQLQILH